VGWKRGGKFFEVRVLELKGGYIVVGGGGGGGQTVQVVRTKLMVSDFYGSYRRWGGTKLKLSSCKPLAVRM